MTQKQVDWTNSKLELLVAGFVFLVAQLFTFHRLFLGVNFFDEPFYLALPFRFLFHQKLFIEDLVLAQTFSLLIYPFIKLHHFLFQSTELIILGMRFWFWILYGLLSFFLLWMLKRMFSPIVLLPVVACSGLFLPGNLPTLSYNTMGTMLLTLGLFALFYGWHFNKKIFFGISGACLSASVLSYPTFFIVWIAVAVGLSIKKRIRQEIGAFLASSIGVIAYPGILFLLRIKHLENSFALAKEYGYSANKLFEIFRMIHQLLPKQVIFALVIYLGWVSIFRHRNRKLLWALSLLPFVAWLLAMFSTRGWPLFPVYLSLLGLIPLLKIKKNLLIKRLTWIVFFPSLVAGFVAAFTSALGVNNAQVGLLPAVLVSLLALSECVNNINFDRRIFKVMVLGFPVILALLTPQILWDEDPMGELTERVLEGPYKGLLTTPEKLKYLNEVSKEIKMTIKSNGPLMIFPNFTAGYLIAGIEPAPGILWYQNPKGGVDKYLAQAYESRMVEGSRILRMKNWYATPKIKAENYVDPQSPINLLIDKKHHRVAENEWFTLYAPN